MNLSANAIEVSDVTKRYGQHIAVDNLSFEVRRGEIFSMLGPNGAGKTTTIRMILDIIRPDTGTITVLGNPNNDAKTLDRVGYLPEERGLYKKMQVRRVLLFLAELKGVKPSDANKRIDEWLTRLSLSSSDRNWGDAKVDE